MAKVLLRVSPETGGGGGKSNKASNKVAPVMSLPGFGDMPLFVPRDGSDAIRLIDNRTNNPATGLPFPKGKAGGKTLSVSPKIIKTIIAHAKAKGVDPYDALSIPYQETGFGLSGTGLGEVKDYFPDQGIEDNFEEIEDQKMNAEVNAMVKGLADKFKYAKSLGRGGDDANRLQGYNGYGKLFPRNGEKVTHYYGIPVTKENPLDMMKNPAYGKTVASLRNILVNNPQIKRLVESTPAFRSVWDAPVEEAAPAQKVALRVNK